MSDDTEDEKWLDALGGKLSNPALPSAADREATAIRNAILRQAEARPGYEPSQARLDMLMAEANRQGLLVKGKAPWGVLAALRRIHAFLAMPASVATSLALVLGLTITVGWQANQMNLPEDRIVRGSSSEERIAQIVPSPMEAAQAWQKDLLAAGVEFAVAYEAPQRILIRMRLTPEAIQVLESRRIQAPPGRWMTLVIETGKSGSQ